MAVLPLSELELLLAAARELRARLEPEAADLLLGCRVRFVPDEAWHPADEFDHVAAVVYAPTAILRRLAADADVRARIRQALDTVQSADVCVDALQLRADVALMPLAQRLGRASTELRRLGSAA